MSPGCRTAGAAAPFPALTLPSARPTRAHSPQLIASRPLPPPAAPRDQWGRGSAHGRDTPRLSRQPIGVGNALRIGQ